MKIPCTGVDNPCTGGYSRGMTMTQTEKIADKIAAGFGGTRTTDLEDLLEQLVDAARRDGIEDLLIDLHDLDVLPDETIECAVANNGVPDPRKRK